MPLFGKDFEIIFRKNFDDTDLRLFSNFTKIGCREVGETMRCFDDKVRKMRFFAAISHPFGGGRQNFSEKRATWADVFL